MICPNCNKEVIFYFDEWGHTPYHLHCNNCGINIGSQSIKKCEELLQKYHKSYTYIEYYMNNIQFLYINGEEIINNEMKW